MERSALRASFPVAFGYVPLGIAFGVLFVQLGYDWWWATAMSVLVFAGSAQFLAVTLLASGAGLVEAAASTLLLNLRHVFYGLTLVSDYKAFGPSGFYATFGLTDETFSLVSSAPPGGRTQPWVMKVTALNQGWWVLGSTIGALLGHRLPFSTKGLDFALTALFTVLLIDQLTRHARRRVLAVTLVIGVVGAVVLPSSSFLVGTMTLAALVVAVVPEAEPV